MFLKIFIGYLIAINILSMIITIYDKAAAKNGKQRVREKTLFVYAFLGGGIMMYLTMLLIRHKTQHTSFMVGIPLIIILQCIVFFLGWSLCSTR